MFITEKRFENRKEWVNEEIKELRKKYWDISRKYDALLEYLGLEEQVITQKIIIVKKETK